MARNEAERHYSLLIHGLRGRFDRANGQATRIEEDLRSGQIAKGNWLGAKFRFSAIRQPSDIEYLRRRLMRRNTLDGK